MPSSQRFYGYGHLGRDVDFKMTKSGREMATFSFAVDESWTDKTTGEKQKHTEWFNCVAYGWVAKRVANGKKGGLVIAEGRFRSNDTTKADGSPIRYTNLVVDSASLCATLPREDDGASISLAKAASTADLDDDIPF